MRKGKSKLKFVINLVLITLLVLSSIFFVTSKVKQSHFQDAQIDEILFYIKIVYYITVNQLCSIFDLRKIMRFYLEFNLNIMREEIRNQTTHLELNLRKNYILS